METHSGRTAKGAEVGMSEDPAALTLIVPHERPVSAARVQLPADPRCGKQRGGSNASLVSMGTRHLKPHLPPPAARRHCDAVKADLYQEGRSISQRGKKKILSRNTRKCEMKRSNADHSAPVNYVHSTSSLSGSPTPPFYDSLNLSCLPFKMY